MASAQNIQFPMWFTFLRDSEQLKCLLLVSIPIAAFALYSDFEVVDAGRGRDRMVASDGSSVNIVLARSWECGMD
jgi:hypothetical protein